MIFFFFFLNFRFQSIYFITAASLSVCVFSLFQVDEKEKCVRTREKCARANWDLSFIPFKTD